MRKPDSEPLEANRAIAEVDALTAAAANLLDNAEVVVASRRGRILNGLTGASQTAARQYVDAARVSILRLSSAQYLKSLLPNIVSEAGAYLPANDLRLAVLNEVRAKPDIGDPLTDSERLQVIAAVQGAQREGQNVQLRIRSFRNVIVGVAVVVSILSLLTVLVGFFAPRLLSTCFDISNPQQESNVGPPPVTLVCPTQTYTIMNVDFAPAPQDVVVVEFVGLLAASIAAAATMRNIRGSSDPYSLPVALAFLKLPTGALTALLGLLLLRANLVPAVTASVTAPGQIIALSLVLGYSQQLFTGLIDRQAQVVLGQSGNTASSGVVRRQ
jgi:hypothetical protein